MNLLIKLILVFSFPICCGFLMAAWQLTEQPKLWRETIGEFDDRLPYVLGAIGAVGLVIVISGIATLQYQGWQHRRTTNSQ